MIRALRFPVAALALLAAACATPNLDEPDDLPPATPNRPSETIQVGTGDGDALDPERAPELPSSTSAPAPKPAATCALPAPGTPTVLTSRWTATAPTSATTTTSSVRERIILADCTMAIATLLLTTTPAATWTIFLSKTDTTPGSCKEPKGFATLVAKTYAAPIVEVATHPTERRLFVVAFSRKSTAEGTLLHDMEQVDFTTGAAIHLSSPYVKGAAQAFPRPASRPSAVAINGCDVTLMGRGAFSGATGTPSDEWVATYPGFVAPQRQAPSAATLAAYR